MTAAFVLEHSINPHKTPVTFLSLTLTSVDKCTGTVLFNYQKLTHNTGGWLFQLMDLGLVVGMPFTHAGRDEGGSGFSPTAVVSN